MKLNAQDGPHEGAAASQEVLTWPGDGIPSILCSAPLLKELTELSQSGFRRYPWGGVELGGLLLGLHEAERTLILAFRTFDHEHENGPEFDLTSQDLDRFATLVEDTAGKKPDGLVPIGWFQTMSGRNFSLSAREQRLRQRLFPGPRHVAMVLKRSKTQPLEIGFYVGNATDSLQLHSPLEALTPQAFQRAELCPAPEPLPAMPAPVSMGAHQVLEPSPAITLPSSMQPDLVGQPEPAIMGLRSRASNPYAFLGLTENPFSLAPDVRYWCPFTQHRKALTTLLYQIQSRAGFAALIGPAGIGKSLLLESLVPNLKRLSIDFAFLTNSTISVAEFYEFIAHDLELKGEHHSKASVLIALNEYLIQRFMAGQTTALIVDNAEKLSIDMLQEIELVGNLEARGGRLLQIVLVAQPELEQRLGAPELRGLQQRMLTRARLTGLDAGETGKYIATRMEKAGLSPQMIVPSELMPEIHALTHGVPRLINVVCSALLGRCIDEGCRVASPHTLGEVTGELRIDDLELGADQSEAPC